MLKEFVEMILALSGPVYFSSPKIQAPQPVPIAPTEDPAAEAERENVRRQATVDLMSGGRRSTMSAGKTLTDEGFLEQVASPKRGRRGASSELGVM